ncbi:hypothetical protein DID73_00005, partial [Candidatus Marinamargulisbacteria bacterium SCGC AG-343-K17]
GNLSVLTKLDLDNNRLESLPDSIGNLSALPIALIGRNQREIKTGRLEIALSHKRSFMRQIFYIE